MGLCWWFGLPVAPCCVFIVGGLLLFLLLVDVACDFVAFCLDRVWFPVEFPCLAGYWVAVCTFSRAQWCCKFELCVVGWAGCCGCSCQGQCFFVAVLQVDVVVSVCWLFVWLVLLWLWLRCVGLCSNVCSCFGVRCLCDCGCVLWW